MTERAFEVEAGGILVRNPDGRVLRQGVPEGVSVASFRHILAVVDLLWNDKGVFPTPHQVVRAWPKAGLSTVQRVFATPEFSQAMEKRGIEHDSSSGLNDRQMTALALLSNPEDRRTVAGKLRDIGVPYGTFQNWMRQPLFARLYRERVERVLEDIIPSAIMAVASNVESGDQRAAEFALKMTGRYDPNAIDAQNARTVVLRLVESIQRHAPKEVREAVLADLDGILTTNRVMKAVEG